MIRTRLYVPAALAAAALSFAALQPNVLVRAQDSADDDEARVVTYVLASGTNVRGTIAEVEGERVRLRLSIAGGGTSLHWYDLQDFEPRSQVRLEREQVAEGDLMAQLGVAELASELELYDQSRTELTRCAHIIDYSGQAPPEAFKPRALQLTVHLLEQLCADGNVSEARRAVSRLLTRRSDLMSEEDQSRLIGTVESAALRIAEAQAAERRAAAESRALEVREEELEPVQRELERGRQHRRSGLLGSRRYTAASRDLRRAVGYFESALEKIEELREENAGDAAMLAELDALAAQATAQRQDSLLSTASLELARGSFNDAMESVNRILVDAPAHAQALAMRARIEVAENDWGWGS